MLYNINAETITDNNRGERWVLVEQYATESGTADTYAVEFRLRYRLARETRGPDWGFRWPQEGER